MIFTKIFDFFYLIFYDLLSGITLEFNEFIDFSIYTNFILKGLYYFDTDLLFIIMSSAIGLIMFRLMFGVIVWVYEHIPFVN